MRKLSELIVIIRGGGEIGSAIAHRLTRSHFRVCITELAAPLAINRGVSYSDAVYDGSKEIEGITADRSLANLEQIYKVWRNGRIPVVVDPDLAVRALLKPDVLINAMMLKRKTSTTIMDAPLVIGVGPGFTVGEDVHIVIESNDSNNLGRIIIEGEAEPENQQPADVLGSKEPRIVYSEESGVFTSDRNIGDTVLADDIIGYLNETPIKAPIAGILCGLVRNEARVLANTKLAEIDPVNDKASCFMIRKANRMISGSVLEAIMMSLNIEGLV